MSTKPCCSPDLGHDAFLELCGYPGRLLGPRYPDCAVRNDLVPQRWKPPFQIGHPFDEQMDKIKRRARLSLSYGHARRQRAKKIPVVVRLPDCANPEPLLDTKLCRQRPIRIACVHRVATGGHPLKKKSPGTKSPGRLYQTHRWGGSGNDDVVGGASGYRQPEPGGQTDPLDGFIKRLRGAVSRWP